MYRQFPDDAEMVHKALAFRGRFLLTVDLSQVTSRRKHSNREFITPLTDMPQVIHCTPSFTTTNCEEQS